jgi:hypothetical protein
MRYDYELYRAIEADRQRDEFALAHIRAIRTGQTRPSQRPRLPTRILSLIRRDHSLTDYPCRLPDRTLGRVAAVLVDGEWTLVCRKA